MNNAHFTINVSYVMLEAKIFKNPKVIEKMKRFKQNKRHKNTKADQGISALHKEEIFFTFKMNSKIL